MSRLIVLTVLAGLSAVAATAPIRGGVRTGRLNGRIAYDRPDPASSGNLFMYTANPDGSHVQRLVSVHPSGQHWSHTGSRLSVSAQAKDGRILSATVGADGSNYKPLSISDPTLNVACNAPTKAPERPAHAALPRARGQMRRTEEAEASHGEHSSDAPLAATDELAAIADLWYLRARQTPIWAFWPKYTRGRCLWRRDRDPFSAREVIIEPRI
jgi:hypothetical protein